MKRILIVGAGLSGATCAIELARLGFDVDIVEQRNHIGGNTFDYIDDHGVLVHKYGPHIFHTNSVKVFNFLSDFTEWRNYEHKVVSRVLGVDYEMPLNIASISKYLKLPLKSAEDLAVALAQKRIAIEKIKTAEDYLYASIGPELCGAFFSGYSRKQWGRGLSELDPSIVARVPVRPSFDDRYFTDQYQGMPMNGYTQLVARMLGHPKINVELGDCVDLDRMSSYDFTIYTGPIDRLLDYKFGRLPYRSLRFEFQHIPDCDLMQPVGTVNYPSFEDGDFTRVTEFKHLTGQKSSGTTLVKEYPSSEGEPYYPIPSPESKRLHERYVAELSLIRPNVHLVGRLAEYRYYNMDQAVASALIFVKRLVNDGQ